MFRADSLDREGTALAAFNADLAVRGQRAEGVSPAARNRIAFFIENGSATPGVGDPGDDDAALYEVH
jgi:hypothetical protein